MVELLRPHFQVSQRQAQLEARGIFLDLRLQHVRGAVRLVLRHHHFREAHQAAGIRRIHFVALAKSLFRFFVFFLVGQHDGHLNHRVLRVRINGEDLFQLLFRLVISVLPISADARTRCAGTLSLS